MSKDHIFSVVKLPNGYLVSIQHSELHNCGTKTVEVAVIKGGKFVTSFPHCDESGVAGYVTAPQLISIIEWAREQKS